jgi:hypothetical protein
MACLLTLARCFKAAQQPGSMLWQVIVIGCGLPAQYLVSNRQTL